MNRRFESFGFEENSPVARGKIHDGKDIKKHPVVKVTRHYMHYLALYGCVGYVKTFGLT